MVTSYQNFIGIDIGKLQNVVAVHKQKSAVEFDNNTPGWQQLFQEFSNVLPNSLVTLENTGKYELGLSHFLTDQNSFQQHQDFQHLHCKLFHAKNVKGEIDALRFTRRARKLRKRMWYS